MLNILGVLRRRQTRADLHSREIEGFLQHPFHLPGTPDIPLIRRATVTRWGSGVFLIPEKPSTAGSFGRRLRREGLGLFVGGGTCCAAAADIQAGTDMLTEGAGRSFAGGSTQTRLILVVPDGVAKVVFVLGRQSAGVENGAPIYRHSLKVAAPVHGNVAAVQVRRECCNGQPPMIWYAANGHVIKRIGNFSSINRVITPPKPGPETPLSRAAERNPATPNHVWVTPRAGGTHANFAVHFRVLLNDADYRYTFSGTRCPQITFPGGSGGGNNDLRGRIWSERLDAVQGQTWCPGTYHVSVSVMDLGRAGNLKHPARPFGTATFTVR